MEWKTPTGSVIFGSVAIRSSHYQDFPIPDLSWKKENSIVDGRESKAGEQKYFNFTARFNRGGSKVGYR